MKSCKLWYSDFHFVRATRNDAIFRGNCVLICEVFAFSTDHAFEQGA
jgi:hypothetical protein